MTLRFILKYQCSNCLNLIQVKCAKAGVRTRPYAHVVRAYVRIRTYTHTYIRMGKRAMRVCARTYVRAHTCVTNDR